MEAEPVMYKDPVHRLKLDTQYFGAVADWSKTFEVRSEVDRTFAVGDILILQEWRDGYATGHCMERRISYVLRGHSLLGEHVAVLGFVVPR